MDMARNNTNVESEKETIHYQAPNISSHSIEMISMGNPMVEMSSSRSCMLDSYCPPIWDQPINGNDARAGASWTPNAALSENMFMLPHVPADSDFIERAARLSCFNGGSFGQMSNVFTNLDALNPRSRSGLVQRPNEAFVLQRGEVSKEGSLKNEKNVENFTQSHDEAKNGVDALGTDQSDEAEFSGRGGQDEAESKALGLKKRKIIEQKTAANENNEAQQPSVDAANEATEFRQKGDQSPSLTGNPGAKGPDPPKDEYIHVRARRGQATNSHSLAERIRREKISERMKFLQDLVPGCSKVTGKAVMLDEIINYVQSLQRQVEFLSMKLATVNPRLDFNMEGFLAKDILQTRAGLSSSLAFTPDIPTPFPPSHSLQPGLIHATLPGEMLQRPIALQSNVVPGEFGEPTSQAPGVWDGELHNVIHNGFNLSALLNRPNLSVSLPGHTKDEP